MQYDIDRFWGKVNKGDPEHCWIWVGGRFSPKNHGRYGAFSQNGKTLRAHRVSWEIFHGYAIPPGMVIMHSCDTPLCVNPKHLVLGTQLENNRDCTAKGRRSSGSEMHRTRDTARGERSGVAKFKNEDILRMRGLRAEGIPYYKIAELFGTSKSNAMRIVKGHTWAHVGKDGSEQGPGPNS